MVLALPFSTVLKPTLADFVFSLSSKSLVDISKIMDSIREKIGMTENPEERAKRQKQLVLPNILSLSLSVTMVIIGYQVKFLTFTIVSYCTFHMQCNAK
jgi:hypothetical protein